MAGESSGIDGSGRIVVGLYGDDEPVSVIAGSVWALQQFAEAVESAAPIAQAAERTVAQFGKVALRDVSDALHWALFVLGLPWGTEKPPAAPGEIGECPGGYNYTYVRALNSKGREQWNIGSNRLPFKVVINGGGPGNHWFIDSLGYNQGNVIDDDGASVAYDGISCVSGQPPVYGPPDINNYNYTYTHKDGSKYNFKLGDLYMDINFAPVWHWIVTPEVGDDTYHTYHKAPAWDPVLGGPIGPPPVPPGGGGGDKPPEWDWELIWDVAKFLWELANSKTPGTLYRLKSVCETAEDGSPVDKAVEVEIPSKSNFAAIVARLDAIPELLQGTKDFKQPICKHKKTLEGREVTVHFREVGGSQRDGRSPVRKRLSYRCLVTPTIEELAAHWEGFAWQTGPVQVRLMGPRFGALIVWADSETEGRRVIRHALEQSGFAEGDGEWNLGLAKNPRYGVGAQVVADHGSSRISPDW